MDDARQDGPENGDVTGHNDPTNHPNRDEVAAREKAEQDASQFTQIQSSQPAPETPPETAHDSPSNAPQSPSSEPLDSQTAITVIANLQARKTLLYAQIEAIDALIEYVASHTDVAPILERLASMN